MSRTEEHKDYYSILGAAEDAPPDEIERRYKRLAVKHHPDRGGDEEEMKNINEAYGVLGNAEARNAYDAIRRPNSAHIYAYDDDTTMPPFSSPSAKADAFGGRMVGAVLFIAAGLVLLLLVRFQYIWFLWPLAILAVFLVVAGVLIAHAALVFAREGFAPTHPARRFAWAQEMAFWLLVCGGIYGLYLVMSAI
ncbi:MAG TPA: DnaJ domain-containing protein [Pyrinomonadaceae bacterium]|jgi:hypothetical protein